MRTNVLNECEQMCFTNEIDGSYDMTQAKHVLWHCWCIPTGACYGATKVSPKNTQMSIICFTHQDKTRSFFFFLKVRPPGIRKTSNNTKSVSRTWNWTIRMLNVNLPFTRNLRRKPHFNLCLRLLMKSANVPFLCFALVFLIPGGQMFKNIVKK